MYKKEIVTHEYVYSEEEQKRLEWLQMELKKLSSSGTYSVQILERYIDEMGDILTGVWSPPMPF